MMKTYDHTQKEEEIAILKKQSFNPEIPKDERDRLEGKIKAMEKKNADLKEYFEKQIKGLAKDYDKGRQRTKNLEEDLEETIKNLKGIIKLAE